jgi:arylsulfatase A-like enzyme
MARLNVLYLVSDDLRPELGAYGSQVKTPNMDRLAADGLVFARAYCQQAVCGPSRNSFMTGRRPHRTNVLGGSTGDDFRRVGIDSAGVPGANWTTLPGHFKRHGYTTLGGGKTFHPNTPKNFDYPESWSTDMAHNHNTTTGQGYFGFDYFLANFSKPFDGGLPISHPCPGVGAPAGEANASGASLGGPIAVWCALDLADEHFYDNGLANNTIVRGDGSSTHATTAPG